MLHIYVPTVLFLFQFCFRVFKCYLYSIIRGKLYDLSCDSWNIDLDEDIRQKMAHMATSVAWGLGEANNPSVMNNSIMYTYMPAYLFVC